MIPGEGAPLLGHRHIGHIVKCIISLKIFFSTSRHRLDKLRVYQDDRGGDFQICKFNDPRGRDSCTGA